MRKHFVPCLAVLALFCASAVSAAEPGWKVWSDSHFGYTMVYPDLFWSIEMPDARDGIKLTGADGETALAVWGQFNVQNKTAAELFDQIKENYSGFVPNSVECWEGGCTFTVTDSGGESGIEHYTTEYYLVTPEVIAAFSYTYRLDEQAETEGQIMKMRNGLRLFPSGILLPAADLLPTFEGDDWSAVQNSDTMVWYFVGPETSGATENDYGVYFADRERESVISFLPCEGNAPKSVSVSPAGSYILIDFGMDFDTGAGEMRDLRVYDFRSLRLLRKFDVVHLAEWIDDCRFVFTMVEGERAGGQPVLSVAVFDANAGLFDYVLKATETASYFCTDLDREEELLNVTEQSVASQEDWKENKTSLRSFQERFPAAG